MAAKALPARRPAPARWAWTGRALVALCAAAGAWYGYRHASGKPGQRVGPAGAAGDPAPPVGKRPAAAAESDAQRRLRLAASVFEATSEGILIVSRDMRIIEANRAFLAMSGYSREALMGQHPRILQSGKQDEVFYRRMWDALNGTGSWQGQIWDRRRDGSLFAAYLTVSRVNDASGALSHYISLFTDITEQRLHLEEIELLAYLDPLTRLPNRRLLQDRLGQAMANSARNETLLAVCSLDLDGFKAINDSRGHEAGDEVLVEIASRLCQVIRANDTVARTGGDEFLLLLADLSEPGEVLDIVGRALAAVREPIALRSGETVAVSASIGIAYFPTHANDAEQLLCLSDRAMYQAKRQGRNCFVLHPQNAAAGRPAPGETAPIRS